MNENFSSYIFNRFTTTLSLIVSIGTIYTYLKTNSVNNTYLVFLSGMVLFLLLTCYRIFKDKRTLSRELANANEEKNQVSTDLKTLQSSFDNTSKAYTKNINELNQHKQVTHVVKMLVESSNPTTKAEKELLQKLKYTVEHSIEGSVDE